MEDPVRGWKFGNELVRYAIPVPVLGRGRAPISVGLVLGEIGGEELGEIGSGLAEVTEPAC